MSFVQPCSRCVCRQHCCAFVVEATSNSPRKGKMGHEETGRSGTASAKQQLSVAPLWRSAVTPCSLASSRNGESCSARRFSQFASCRGCPRGTRRLDAPLLLPHSGLYCLRRTKGSNIVSQQQRRKAPLPYHSPVASRPFTVKRPAEGSICFTGLWSGTEACAMRVRVV